MYNIHGVHCDTYYYVARTIWTGMKSRIGWLLLVTTKYPGILECTIHALI